MLEALNSFCLTVTDPVLGWLLNLPRDLALVIVGLLTAGIFTVVRLFTTDQEYLKRCKRDKARLKSLLREAKAQGDKDAVQRYRQTLGQIGMWSLKAEGKPLLVAIVPIALIGAWCWARVAYVPPEPGEPVPVRAYFPVAEIDKLVHIVPQDGVMAENGWIRRIRADVTAEGKVTNGIAEWTLRCERRDEPYRLEVRYEGGTFCKELLVDGRHYAPPLKAYDGEGPEVVEVALEEYKFLGFVPGISAIMLQPWIVGYLIVVFPLSFILRPALRIC